MILYITGPSALSDRTPYFHSKQRKRRTIFKAFMAFFLIFFLNILSVNFSWFFILLLLF